MAAVRHLGFVVTVVRECCKGDEASQWRKPKFDPPPRLFLEIRISAGVWRPGAFRPPVGHRLVAQMRSIGNGSPVGGRVAQWNALSVWQADTPVPSRRRVYPACVARWAITGRTKTAVSRTSRMVADRCGAEVVVELYPNASVEDV